MIDQTLSKTNLHDSELNAQNGLCSYNNSYL